MTQPRSYLIVPLIGGGALAPRDADAQPPRLPHDGQCQLEAEGTVVMGQGTPEPGTTLLTKTSNSETPADTLGVSRGTPTLTGTTTTTTSTQETHKSPPTAEP